MEQEVSGRTASLLLRRCIPDQTTPGETVWVCCWCFQSNSWRSSVFSVPSSRGHRLCGGKGEAPAHNGIHPKHKNTCTEELHKKTSPLPEGAVISLLPTHVTPWAANSPIKQLQSVHVTYCNLIKCPVRRSHIAAKNGTHYKSLLLDIIFV